jgi:hypothetical protein
MDKGERLVTDAMRKKKIQEKDPHPASSSERARPRLAPNELNHTVASCESRHRPVPLPSHILSLTDSPHPLSHYCIVPCPPKQASTKTGPAKGQLPADLNRSRGCFIRFTKTGSSRRLSSTTIPFISFILHTYSPGMSYLAPSASSAERIGQGAIHDSSS